MAREQQFYDPSLDVSAAKILGQGNRLAYDEVVEEEREKDKKLATGAKFLFSGYKLAEGKRAGDLAETNRLLNEIDPESRTFRKYQRVEPVKTDSIFGALRQRYFTPASERVQLAPRRDETYRGNLNQLPKQNITKPMPTTEREAREKVGRLDEYLKSKYSPQVKNIDPETTTSLPFPSELDIGTKRMPKNWKSGNLSSGSLYLGSPQMRNIPQSDYSPSLKMATPKTTEGFDDLFLDDPASKVPGLQEVATGMNLYNTWSSNADPIDKVSATAETGLDYASSAAIASGSPLAPAAIAYKGGKFLWDMLT